MSTFNASRLIWAPDRLLINDLVLRLQHYKNDDWELGANCLLFFKIKGLVDQYERFWSTRPDFQISNVLELGMFDGGSLAFWMETLNPNKIVGVDLESRTNSPYFNGYLASRNLRQRVKTYWGVDQSDATALREIAQTEFGGKLDLVIDDASHFYSLSKASFEILFPLLRPGGLYVIEDWAWGHWPEFYVMSRPWTVENEPTRLIIELMEACGSVMTQSAGGATGAIASVTVYQGFVVVERGKTDLPKPRFNLEEYINRRLPQSRRWGRGNVIWRELFARARSAVSPRRS
jgi:cephalosporin hydroxylase